MLKNDDKARRKRAGRFPMKKQLEAAATVHPYEAWMVLSAVGIGDSRTVPERKWFAEHFFFTRNDLLGYLRADHLRRNEIVNRSLDNRALPDAYIVPDPPNGFKMGWFDGADHDVRQYSEEEAVEAVADYVLAYWGLDRLNRSEEP
jgi:hypothetical protein